MDFKIGDRAKNKLGDLDCFDGTCCMARRWNPGFRSNQGRLGTISAIKSNGWVEIYYDGGGTGGAQPCHYEKLQSQMEEFKVGDEVIIRKPRNVSESPSWVYGMDKYDGCVRVIASMVGSYVDLRDAGGYSYSVSWLEHSDKSKNKITIMEKITNAFKKFLNADLQGQVKAGFRNGGLELTEQGRIAAIEALLDASPEANKAFSAAAQAIVDEAEKKDK